MILNILNMDSIYNIFPKEIWILIILEIPYSHIPNIYKDKTSPLCKAFEKLVDDENLLQIRKKKNYPRTNRSAEAIYKCHDLSETDISYTLWSPDYNNAIYNEGYLKSELHKIADKLDDPVRGDFIRFKNFVLFIFDGEKILNNRLLCNNMLILPEEFDPIKENVSIKYWVRNPINVYFFLDISYFREQLLANVSIVNDISYTFLITNNIKHVIVSDIHITSYGLKKGLSLACNLYLHYDPKYIFQIDEIITNVYKIRSLY